VDSRQSEKSELVALGPVATGVIVRDGSSMRACSPRQEVDAISRERRVRTTGRLRAGRGSLLSEPYLSSAPSVIEVAGAGTSGSRLRVLSRTPVFSAVFRDAGRFFDSDGKELQDDPLSPGGGFEVNWEDQLQT